MCPLTPDDVSRRHPGWRIAPTWSPRGWTADARLSPTATRTIAGYTLAELDRKLTALDGDA